MHAGWGRARRGRPPQRPHTEGPAGRRTAQVELYRGSRLLGNLALTLASSHRPALALMHGTAHFRFAAALHPSRFAATAAATKKLPLPPTAPLHPLLAARRPTPCQGSKQQQGAVLTGSSAERPLMQPGASLCRPDGALPSALLAAAQVCRGVGAWMGTAGMQQRGSGPLQLTSPIATTRQHPPISGNAVSAAGAAGSSQTGRPAGCLQSVLRSPPRCRRRAAGRAARPPPAAACPAALAACRRVGEGGGQGVRRRLRQQAVQQHALTEV